MVCNDIHPEITSLNAVVPDSFQIPIMSLLDNLKQVIVIPWVVRLYVEIIHELLRVDYLTYRWTNMVSLFYTTYISVDLAHQVIFHAKVGKGGINTDIRYSHDDMITAKSRTLTIGIE